MKVIEAQPMEVWPSRIIKLRAGDPVWWMRSLGGAGGAGKRPNSKEPTPAFFVRMGGGRRVLVRPIQYGRLTEETWVDWWNVFPREGSRARRRRA